MASITRPVGRGVTNLNRNEVRLVQQLLNRHRSAPLKKIGEDGLIGTETIKAIEEFQCRVVRMKLPDGRVDPAGATFKALSANGPGAPPPPPPAPASKFVEGLASVKVSNSVAQANATAVLQAL